MELLLSSSFLGSLNFSSSCISSILFIWPSLFWQSFRKIFSLFSAPFLLCLFHLLTFLTAYSFPSGRDVSGILSSALCLSHPIPFSFIVLNRTRYDVWRFIVRPSYPGASALSIIITHGILLSIRGVKSGGIVECGSFVFKYTLLGDQYFICPLSRKHKLSSVAYGVCGDMLPWQSFPAFSQCGLLFSGLRQETTMTCHYAAVPARELHL